MKKHKRTLNQTKILEGMDKVYEKLIEFKKKMNSELVILKDNQIVRLKPYILSPAPQRVLMKSSENVS